MLFRSLVGGVHDGVQLERRDVGYEGPKWSHVAARTASRRRSPSFQRSSSLRARIEHFGALVPGSCNKSLPMAKKEDRKKQKKRLKEKSKARKRVERNKYPRIEVLDDGEDKAFMSTVKQIVAEFDFENDAHCRPQERVLYHFHRQIGLDGLEEVCELPALSEIAEAHGENIEDFRHDLFLALFTHFGKWIFDQLPEAYRRLPLPFYYYHATPLGRNLIVTFQFLPRVKGPHGTIYHSPHEPTVNTRAGDRKVGFSRHAIEQA